MGNGEFDPNKHLLLQEEETKAEENKTAGNGGKDAEILKNLNLSEEDLSEEEESKTGTEENNGVTEVGSIAVSDKTGTTVEKEIPIIDAGKQNGKVITFGGDSLELSEEEKNRLIRRICILSLEKSLDENEKKEISNILEQLGHTSVNQVWEIESENIPKDLKKRRANPEAYSEISIGDGKKSARDYITAFFSGVWLVISFFFSRNGRKYSIPALVLGLIALILFVILPNYPKWFERDETKGDVLKKESSTTSSSTASSITTVHESFHFVSASIFVETNNDGVPMAYVAIDVLKDKEFVPVEFSVPDSVITRRRDQKKGYQWVYIQSKIIEGKRIIKEVSFHVDEFWRINRMVAR